MCDLNLSESEPPEVPAGHFTGETLLRREDYPELYAAIAEGDARAKAHPEPFVLPTPGPPSERLRLVIERVVAGGGSSQAVSIAVLAVLQSGDHDEALMSLMGRSAEC